jgi:hypothetical protein
MDIGCRTKILFEIQNHNAAGFIRRPISGQGRFFGVACLHLRPVYRKLRSFCPGELTAPIDQMTWTAEPLTEH